MNWNELFQETASNLESFDQEMTFEGMTGELPRKRGQRNKGVFPGKWQPAQFPLGKYFPRPRFPISPWPGITVIRDRYGNEPPPKTDKPAQEPGPSGSSPGSGGASPNPDTTMPEGSEYIRWVQNTLNNMLGLRLPLDGIMGPETRSAIRSFQQKQGLPVDGLVGPNTERALIAASGGQPSDKSAEFEAFDTESADREWEAEVNRSSRDYIKWVQQSLNQIMGLRLAVDGKMGPQTRSAIRSFQQKQGLRADGIIGDKTEAAIKAASVPDTRIKPALFQYVKDFSGPAAECSDALKRAGKTRAEALTIINAQIDVAIAMLRKAAADLKRGSRSSATRNLFLEIFRVRPEFVPTWLKTTAMIKDRGDVVATRCKRVAELLASGKIKFFCSINSTNCPDCGNDSSSFACSSWGDESVAPRNSNVICLGNAFWDAMRAGDTKSLLATVMHEPFHIYYGRYVTEHVLDRGKFGGIDCILTFVFEINGQTAPDLERQGCANIAVRRELEFRL